LSTGTNPEYFEGGLLGTLIKVVVDPDILKRRFKKVDIFDAVEAVIRLCEQVTIPYKYQLEQIINKSSLLL